MKWLYLDNAATTPVREEVLQAFVEASHRFFANPSSLHAGAREAQKLIEEATVQMRALLGAPEAALIHTSGGTEANNAAILGALHALGGKGRVLVTSIEHASVEKAAAHLQGGGVEVETIPVDGDGSISLSALEEQLGPDVRFVSAMHVNNETGVEQPLASVRRLLDQRAPRARLHVDAVQSFGKIDVDFRRLGADYMTLSAHKFGGLKGSGLLAVRRGAPLAPILYGGGQQDGLRSGTVSPAHFAALAKAMRLAVEGREALEKTARALTGSFLQAFAREPMLYPLDLPHRIPHILSVGVQGVRGEVVVNALERTGALINTASACSSRRSESRVAALLDIPTVYRRGIVRMSVGHANEVGEALRLIEAWTRALDLIKGGTAI